MTTAVMTARERQLDWLLAEVLGGVTAVAVRTATRAVPATGRWLAAALVVLAAAVAFGVALLRSDGEAPPVQQPVEPPFLEIYDPKELDATPLDTRALRCFDFTDAAMAQLPKFTSLERLDLGGMAVNDKGWSRSPQFTDAGLAHVGKLANLRWLSLDHCENWKGPGLKVLEQLPLLEHLDLTFTCVDSPALERLARLPSLRELTLSYCTNFHGRSLAEVAKIPGLRRLELRGCVTLSAADVMQLTKLSALRHLDLRDCQGRYRGQTLAIDDFGGKGEVVTLDDVTEGKDGKEVKEPAKHPEPPKQDGVGITDDCVAALGRLKLETFLLGGSESLTDAIGDTLAGMTALRALDLHNLPKTTGALLAKVPPGLVSLAVGSNRQYDGTAFGRLPPLPGLRELDLSDLIMLKNDQLRSLLQGKTLHVLKLGAPIGRDMNPARKAEPSALDAGAAAVIAKQRALKSLDLNGVQWLSAATMTEIAGLPALEELDLTWAPCTADTLAPLSRSPSLRSLKLVWCRSLDAAALKAVSGARLTSLDVYGTNLKPDDVRELAKAWPGCTIKLADGQRHLVPR